MKIKNQDELERITLNEAYKMAKGYRVDPHQLGINIPNQDGINVYDNHSLKALLGDIYIFIINEIKNAE